MRRQLNLYPFVFSLALAIVLEAPAAGQTYTSIDYPGGAVTIAGDINNAGQIVGRYFAGGATHGFLLSNGSFSTIDFPAATGFTRAVGINRHGDIVGDYKIKNVEHSYLLSGGAFTSIDFPGATGTVAEGIDTSGDIVGFYADNQGKGHGFLLSGGTFASIDFPGAASTQAWRINDYGQIVGRYLSNKDGKWHLYRLIEGTFIAVADFPGAAQTAPEAYGHLGGLNLQADIASSYCSSTPCNNFLNDNVGESVHGFLLSGGVYTTIDAPGAMGTFAFGVNDSNDIVGAYIDTSGAIHGFLRTP